MTAPTTSSSSLQCKANCVVISSGQQLSATVAVLGTLSLTQQHAALSADSNSKNASVVRITGTLHNLSPGSHGICLCAAGDLSKGASSCGPIFNPFGTTDTMSFLSFAQESDDDARPQGIGALSHALFITLCPNTFSLLLYRQDTRRTERSGTHGG
jgi:hypothetical protein